MHGTSMLTGWQRVMYILMYMHVEAPTRQLGQNRVMPLSIRIVIRRSLDRSYADLKQASWVCACVGLRLVM